MADLIRGRWQDKDTFGCPHCAFDSLNEDTTLEHIALKHRFEVLAQPIPMTATLFDPQGNLISSR